LNSDVAGGTFLQRKNATTEQSYFAYDANNLYFAYDGTGSITSAPTTFITIYIGDGSGSSGGTLTVLPRDQNATTPYALPAGFDAKYAFAWATDNSAIYPFAFSSANGSWGTGAFTVTVGYIANAKVVEFSVPRAAFTGITQPTVLGALTTSAGVGTGAATVGDTWPDNSGKAPYENYFDDQLASCTYPNANVVSPQ
jgi:hypothetical protein